MSIQTNKTFCKNLDMLIKENNDTYENYAHSIGTTTAIIPAIKRGLYSPSINVLIKTADYFGCSLDYLLNRSNFYSIL